jgi:hypothetical protein
MTPPTPETYEAHHADNQRRFTALETGLAENTNVTKGLAADTAELVEMWKDAGVFFKWMRKLGTAAIWLGKVSAVLVAAYAAYKQWIGPK